MEDGRQIYGRKTIVRLHGHMLLRCRIFFIFFRILERRSRPRCSFLSYNSPSANKRRPGIQLRGKPGMFNSRNTTRGGWGAGVFATYQPIIFLPYNISSISQTCLIFYQQMSNLVSSYATLFQLPRLRVSPNKNMQF